MKKLVMLVCLVTSTFCFAYTTYNSDGTFSQTESDGRGGSTTYNSTGTWSQTTGD